MLVPFHTASGLYYPRLFKISSCQLPAEYGACSSQIPRFYFDGENCSTFFYSGCGGNRNNFWSVTECNLACRQRSRDSKLNLLNSRKKKLFPECMYVLK